MLGGKTGASGKAASDCCVRSQDLQRMVGHILASFTTEALA